jgi:hypothetical protein
MTGQRLHGSSGGAGRLARGSCNTVFQYHRTRLARAKRPGDAAAATSRPLVLVVLAAQRIMLTEHLLASGG